MVPVHHSPDKVVVGATTLLLALDVSSIRVRKIKENIATQRSILHDVFAPFSESFSTAVLTGTYDTFNIMRATADTTKAMSITFSFASTIAAISVDDYEVVGTDDQANADENAEPFPNIDDAELNIPQVFLGEDFNEVDFLVNLVRMDQSQRDTLVLYGFEVLDGYNTGYGLYSLYYVDLDDKDLTRYPKLSAHCEHFRRNHSMTHTPSEPESVTLISKLDLSDPLHLHPNDSATLTIVSVKLKGTENYQIWYCAMMLALEGKNKTGFIDGSCKRSNVNEVLGRQWDRVNAIVLGWILKSISKELFLGQIFSKKVKHVWDELKETYDKVDGSVTFNLHHKINSLCQNGSTLADYYHNLNAL
nr:ribonuclease H-like domain-containing protein [Tanacetum cinerariifolium]